MSGFHIAWVITGLLLVLTARWAGRKVKIKAVPAGSYWGILIDERERFSLNRLQLVVWSILILSTFLALLAHAIVTNSGIAAALDIPPQILGLMAISGGTAVLGGAVKDRKNITRPHHITGGAGWIERAVIARTVIISWAQDRLQPRSPHFAQVFLEEEGTGGENEIVSITKFQNFVFTFALSIVYVALTIKANGYPTMDEQVLWLVGISHAGYVGGKVPDKG